MNETNLSTIRKVISIFTEKADSLVPDAAERTSILTSLDEEYKRIIKREGEDHRLASQMAVDAAKAFVQIGVGVLAGIIALYQFAFDRAWGTPTYILGLAAILTVISMISGFMAMSKAYKRGDGRKNPNDTAWSTESLKNELNAQAITGLVALVTIAIAIGMAASSQPKAVYITLPNESATLMSPSETQFEVARQWSELKITSRAYSVDVPVTQGTAASIKFDFR